MSLPFERSIVPENMHQLPDPRNQNGRWECSQCKHEYHVPPIQSLCTVCRGNVVRTMDSFQRHGQPHFDLYTPTGAQIYPPNQHLINSVAHSTNSIPNLFYIATVDAPDDSYDTLSATWHNFPILILLRNVSEPLVSYKEFGALLKAVKGTLLKDVLSSIRERATCLHDYQMDCFRREPFFNRIKTSFITLRIFLRVCVNVKLTPLESMEKLLYVNTDDDLVYILPVLSDSVRFPRSIPTAHPQNNFVPPPMQPFPLPTQRHKPLMPYSHGNPNFTPCKPKLDLPQNINNFTPQVVNNNNIPSFRSSPLIGQSNELSQEMQLCNSIGPNLSEDLYKHPLPRGCAITKTQSHTAEIPIATDGCHGAVTPDTPSIERLDSVSTPSPAPLSPGGDQMDTSDTLPDARILRLPDGQDIVLLMKEGEPHLATPLLYIVFPQLKRHHIDCTKNRHDLNLQPKNSTQLEVKVLRDFGMVGKKTFRCLLFSLSDVAKMVRRVDVLLPDCIQKVIDGEIPEERASLHTPVMLGNGFINKPVGNPDKQKQKQTMRTANDSSSTFDWSIGEETETKVAKLPVGNKNITPFLPSHTVFSENNNNDDYLTIDSVVLNNFDMSSLPKFIDLPPVLPEGLEELGAEFYSASEGQFYSALTEEMGRVSLLALSFKGFMVCLKELYLNYLSQAGNRHTMKFKMRKLGITSMKATSWQRHKLVELKALPSLCSICGLITLSEAKRLCAAYKYSFPDTLDKLISITDRKCKNGRLAVSIPLNSLTVRPRTPVGDISGTESDTTPEPQAVKKHTSDKEEKSKVLKLHLSQQPLNNFATPTRAPKTIKLNPNNTIGTKKCKECGLVQSRFAKKCSQCHAYLQGSPCPKCEKLNIAYYSHCYSCFTKLDKNRSVELIKPRGRISKKKLLQNQLDSVPNLQNGTITSPIQVSCIRCGKIKQTGKFNCLRCGNTFNVSSSLDHSNHRGRKECMELCDSHEDLKIILELFENLKELDLVSVLLPLVSKIRTETLELLERQELTLNELERRKNTSTQSPNMKEKEKIEFKITKLEQQTTATSQEILITNQQIQTNKQILTDKENKILENKNNIYDCEKFIKMLPSS